MANFLKKINFKQWTSIAMFIIGASMMIFSAPLLKSDDFGKLIWETILSTTGFFIVFFSIIFFIAVTWGENFLEIFKTRFFRRK